MNKIIPVLAISVLLVSGCGSESDGDEESPTGTAGSQTQKMLANCDKLQNVTFAFTEEYAEGNYSAAAEALMVRPGSLASVAQTEEESDLIKPEEPEESVTNKISSSGELIGNSKLMGSLHD